MRRLRLPRWIGALGVTALLLGLPAGCDDGTTAPEATGLHHAHDWVNSVDWDAATVVTVNMVENPNSLAFEPNALTFEAGKPYILKIVNPAGNSSKHYFATEGLGDFYQAIATRKIQTSEAEYKAPHFEAVELKIGGSLEIYFVAVLPGTYETLCTITGHKAQGMFGTATITGGEGYKLDLEVASDFNSALASDARKSGSHAVWSSAVNTSVTIVETPYSFVPTDLALTAGVAYKISINNPAGNASKHYYTAAGFYKTVVTRKAEDSQAEIKALYFNAIELLVGGTTELFMVPTVAGTYETLCTITGHADQGMRGTVSVASGSPTPVTASEWVSNADWNAATTVTVNMVENQNSLAFEPNALTFEAGKPYILTIVNSASNSSKHYFATEGLGDFYQAIATRKIQTSQAEYKAPHFEAVELKIGGSLEIYFVAVLPGTYETLCTITGHKALGMFGTATITGGEGYELDLEVASNFNSALASDARKSGSHAVWDVGARVDATVGIVEAPFSFVPTDLALNKDVGYKIIINNPAGHASKHYYTAAEFYKTVVTRKAEDSDAEIKPLYFKEIELLIGGTTELFMVPTVAGTYNTLCTITGHADLGMRGTVVVSP